MVPLPSSSSHTAAAALRHARKLLFVRIHQLGAEPDAAFCAAFQSIVTAIEADLAHEEKVMHERLAENSLLLASLHRIVTQVERGDAALGRMALEAAADLLSLHRLTTDLALVMARPGADHLKKRRTRSKATLR
jgi:hypothetical protein